MAEKKGKTSRDRLIICLTAYDPYKDVFDIFMDLFLKNWSDCPYKLIIVNMFFDYHCDKENVILFKCGDEKNPTVRTRKVLKEFDADYFLFMEEDRVIMNSVKTKDIEDILDFMDDYNINYYRCNASFFKKKEKNKYENRVHQYHIPSKEPYGVSGATAIWKREYFYELMNNGLDDGYLFEAEQLRRAYISRDKWVENAATDDRNVFHILHCVDKQRWIPRAQRILKKRGYQFDDKVRKRLTLKENLYCNVRSLCKIVPIGFRHGIKSILKKIGFKFVTDY